MPLPGILLLTGNAGASFLPLFFTFSFGPFLMSFPAELGAELSDSELVGVRLPPVFLVPELAVEAEEEEELVEGTRGFLALPFLLATTGEDGGLDCNCKMLLIRSETEHLPTNC